MGTDNGEIVRTHVGLYERHRDWARENNINLSAQVRELLDDEMQES